MTDRLLQEVVDRTRRIETRLTKFLEEQGFDTKVRRPVFRAGEVIVPSMDCSLREALASVPDTWPRDHYVAIVHKDVVLARFLKP